MNEQTLFALMVDLHREGERQGPGSKNETLRILELCRLDKSSTLQVADIGCGTGASTLVLAENLKNARITAVDLFPEFLSILSQRAKEVGVFGRVDTREQSMDSLTFEHDALDLIWSEGAIYNIGFKKGIELWRPFLKAGGILAVSEITWLHPNPPEELRKYWESEYPEIATAADKIAALELAGYDLIGYSVLPPSSWIDNYYAPTETRLSDFLKRHAGIPEAEELIAMERQEAALYERFQEWFSYGFYVARKR